MRDRLAAGIERELLLVDRDDDLQRLLHLGGKLGRRGRLRLEGGSLGGLLGRARLDRAGSVAVAGFALARGVVRSVRAGRCTGSAG